MRDKIERLKKISHKENIENLIKKYGKNYTWDDLKIYEDKIEKMWQLLSNKKSESSRTLTQVYQAIMEPFVAEIEETVFEISNVEIKWSDIKYSIQNYFGINLALMSDEINQCAMNNYGKDNYIDGLMNDKVMFKSLFKSFPFWTYSLFQFLEKSTAYLVEVFTNLSLEFLEIQNKLGIKEFKIFNVKLESGDRHDGKFVMEFITSEKNLFYKPRECDTEICLKKIMAFLSKHSEDILDLKFPVSIYINGHQWVIEDKYKPLIKQSDEKKYYFRMGEILALYYLLDGNDLHFENIISSCEYPVLIDTETIFSNRMMTKIEGENILLSKEENAYSVISIKDIGIIPNYIKIGKDSVNISAIRNRVDEKINKKYKIDKSKLHMAGEYLTVDEICQELMKGFSAVYQVFMLHKTDIYEHIKDCSKNMCVRYLKRPTNDYSKIKNAIMKPICFFDYQYAFAITTHVFGTSEKPSSVELSEQRDLLHLNIPKFMINVSEKNLYWNKTLIKESYFINTPLEVIEKKLNYLGEEDLHNQLHIITMMFESMKGIKFSDIHKLMHSMNKCRTIYSGVEFKMQLNKKYDQIVSSIVNNKKINPISKERLFFGYQLQGEHYQALMLPNNYYSGLIGFIEVLLKDDNGKYRETLKQYVEELKKMLIDKLPNMNEGVLTGAYDGLGMYIKIIHEIYEAGLIEDTWYIKIMECLIEQCSKAIKQDKKYDVLNGNAGLLIVLDSIMQQSITHIFREKLKKLTKKTILELKKSVVRNNGKCYFPVNGLTNLFFTGYAHGSAGIITALYKGMKAIGEIDYDIIKELLSTERDLFDSKDGIWYKDNKRDSYSWGWCHGIPGILLSRIELWKSGYRDSDIYEEIETLVTISLEKALGHNLTFCHGDFATIAIIEYAYTILKPDERLQKVEEYKKHLLQRVILTDKKVIVRGMETVGLMDGLLGIAYFVKCEEIEQIPINVLTMKLNNSNERLKRYAV